MARRGTARGDARTGYGMIQERPYLPYGRQRLSHIGIEAVERVLREDFLTTGPMVPAFESTLASTVAAKHAVAC